MTVVYGLYDHNCLRLADLVFLKQVRMQYFVCNCSPCERYYQVYVPNYSASPKDPFGTWQDLDYCIYCGCSMHDSLERPSQISLRS